MTLSVPPEFIILLSWVSEKPSNSLKVKGTVSTVDVIGESTNDPLIFNGILPVVGFVPPTPVNLDPSP